MNSDRIAALADAANHGHISRRDFLRAAAGLDIAVLAAVPMLSGHGPAATPQMEGRRSR